MKKSIYLVLLFLSFQTFAQNNAIKLNITSLFVKNLYVSYERAIDEKTSIALDASILIPKKIPNFLLDVPNEEVVGGKFDISQLKNTNINGFQFTPSARFYLGNRKTLQGFYTEVYARYRRYYLDANFKDEDYDATIKMNWNKFGIGGAIGSQWIINDKVCIDVMFLGLDLSYHTLNFKGSTNHPNANYYIDNEYMEEVLPYISKILNIDVSSTQNSFSTSTGAILLGTRCKIAIGYTF